MLLEFKVKNYKSFKNEVTLSLIPAKKQKDLEFSVLNKKIGKRNFKALSTAVLYGPNASGKTNIISAIETLLHLINRGHIRNDVSSILLNVASMALEFIPNKDLKDKQPVEFYISFIKNNNHIEYSLKIDLGSFLENIAPRNVIYEELKTNNLTLFTREEEIIKLNSKYSKIQKLISIFSANLNKEELFLSNGFKNMVDNSLFNDIYQFLNNDLTVIFGSDKMYLRPAEIDTKVIKHQELANVATEIGALNTDIRFFSNEEGTPKKLTTFINLPNQKNDVHIPAEFIESYGTIRFLHLYPAIKKTLKEGGILIVDEFDASIHPMVLLDIVNIFHNDEINVNHSQLIFNTHNPIFLSPSVLRRDEIKFIDRDENGSTIYSLADFKTTGERGVRTTDDYMKHYFVSKYGAILDIDLSNLFNTNNQIEEADA